MTGWFEGSKSPGINSLEHEIKDTEVDAFIAAFPVGKSNGWNIMSIPDAFNQPWYSNSEGNSAPVTTRSIGEGTFTGSGAMTMTAEDKASANATTSTSSMSASASASASGSGSSASASASLTSASSASSAAQNGNGAASSGAANAQTSQPSNGATSLVIGTSSLWAIVAMISALVL
jgi:chitin deacetylase